MPPQVHEAVFAPSSQERITGDDRPPVRRLRFRPSDEFFLVGRGAVPPYPDRAWGADFGFLVSDLEAVHQRALTVGGTEISAPADVEGMPRTSTIVDPSGNLINLYQNV
jgi:hypothetical protein